MRRLTRVSGSHVPGLRPLVALVSAVVLCDTIFYAAITPLLPTYAEELGLGKTGAGILEASYAAGTLTAAIPAGMLAARIGLRPTVLVGLALLGAASLTFGLAESIVLLDAARFLQGVGSACSWAGALGWMVSVAPAARRGELIGAAMGAAIAGALLGPALGALAEGVGTEPVFSLAALLAVGLAFLCLRLPAPGHTGAADPRSLARAIRDGRVAIGMALVTLPGALFATIGVLGPLRLDALGAGAVVIGATFVMASAVEALTSPVVGRVSDRLGRLVPIRIGLLLATPFLLAIPHPEATWAVTALIVLVAPAIGASWAPAMALLTDGVDARGVSVALGFSLMNAAWGIGHVIGGAGGGALGDAIGDVATFAVLAALSLGVALALMRARGLQQELPSQAAEELAFGAAGKAPT
jgi:predicted MFS family arabinose efflux permease